MSKPTPEELEHALERAKTMREMGNDPDFVAKSFLNCHFQATYLEQVLHAAEHYIISLYRLLFLITATHNAKISGASFCVLWFFLLAVLLLMPFTLEKEIATATSIATQHQILEIPHSYKH